jgi:fused signal recognition particle receptor
MISFFKKWINQIKDGPVDWDELESVLIQSDLGITLAQRILDNLKKQAVSASIVEQAAAEEILKLWPKPVRELKPAAGQLNIWLIVGVNGTGKTTSIAKLAKKFSSKHRVHLVAADTFRAAAIDQLKIWSEKLGVGFHAGREGGDPAAAAFEGIEAARKAGSDLVLIDTAGRLHNKDNLMRELEKVKRVIQKQDATAPQEMLAVLDGTNGLNAVSQAREFHKTVGLTGAIVTKLDSSAKGGTIAALKAELDLETLLLGTGEQADDLIAFEPKEYVKRFF